MPTLTPTLRYLGLAEHPRTTPPPRRTLPTDGTAEQAETGQGASRRPAARPPVLTWLGLAEPRVTVTGHPRIRERLVEQFARRRRRQQVVTGSVGMLMVLILAGWGLLRSPLLAVESVTVVGIEGVQATEVRDVIPVSAGENVLDIDLTAVHDTVVDLPFVAAATVRRRLPSTVEIRVATRRPVLAGQFAGSAYLIDGEGVVIGVQGDTGGLPTVVLTAAPTMGEAMEEPATLALSRVAEQMPPGMNRWITGYSTGADNEVDAQLTIPTTSGPAELTVHLGRPVSVPIKAATIASLVEETVGRGMRPQALDVRIPDRPVVLG